MVFSGTIVVVAQLIRESQNEIRHERLQSVANDKALVVNTFLESQKEKLSVIASMDVFKEAILYPDDKEKIETAYKRIQELKNIIPGISVLTNGAIVVIAENDLPGTDYSGQPYFALKEKKIVFEQYYDPLRKKEFYAVVGPVYDSKEPNNIIGEIAFDIELNQISVLLKESVDSGTDEVYLIDRNGLLLSGSEYIGKGNKNGVLIQEVKSTEAKECLEDLKEYGGHEEVEEHEEEEPAPYLNYMGDEVIGAHGYAPLIMGCVIAEERIDSLRGLGALLFDGLL
jgi:C4-dicarboxylate-specific signal transduction histidine kinase